MFAKQEVPARQGENKKQQSSVENTVRKEFEMSQGAFFALLKTSTHVRES